jgi:hypothetical protein
MATKPARQYLTVDGRQHLYDQRNRKHAGKPYAEAKIATQPVSCWLIEAYTGEKRMIVGPATLTLENVVNLFQGLKWRKEFTVSNVTAADCPMVDAGKMKARMDVKEGLRVNQKMEIV